MYQQNKELDVDEQIRISMVERLIKMTDRDLLVMNLVLKIFGGFRTTLIAMHNFQRCHFESTRVTTHRTDEPSTGQATSGESR